MIFGLPGAALAMYRCARLRKKKVAGGLLLGGSDLDAHRHRGADRVLLPLRRTTASLRRAGRARGRPPT